MGWLHANHHDVDRRAAVSDCRERRTKGPTHPGALVKGVRKHLRWVSTLLLAASRRVLRSCSGHRRMPRLARAVCHLISTLPVYSQAVSFDNRSLSPAAWPELAPGADQRSVRSVRLMLLGSSVRIPEKGFGAATFELESHILPDVHQAIVSTGEFDSPTGFSLCTGRCEGLVQLRPARLACRMGSP